MSDIISVRCAEYATVQKQIEDLQEKAKATVKDIVPAVMADFFERNPEVYGIGWVQYAPHWNDGDACEFSVHELQLWLDQESFEDGSFYESDADGLDPESQRGKDFDQIVDLIGSIEEEYLEEIYGDGVSVVFTKDGVKVSNHRHD